MQAEKVAAVLSFIKQDLSEQRDFPTVGRICTAFGWGETVVNGVLLYLIEHGLVIREPNRDKSSRRRYSYELVTAPSDRLVRRAHTVLKSATASDDARYLAESIVKKRMK